MTRFKILLSWLLLVLIPGAELSADTTVHRLVLYFGKNSDALTKEGRLTVNNFAGMLKRQKQITKVEIQGHCDASELKKNRKLCQGRADRVFRALTVLGISSGRLVVKAYGAKMPIGSNSTPEGRARNRRVNLRLLEFGAPGPTTPPKKRRRRSSRP